MILLFSLALIGGIIVIANLYQAQQFTNRTALNGLYIALSVLIILMGGLVLVIALSETNPLASPDEIINTVEIPNSTGIGLFIISLVLGIFSIGLTLSRPLRLWLQKFIVQSDGVEKRKHADSVVHTLAVILMFFASVFTVGNFIIAGGIEGLAESIGDINAIDLWSNFALYVVLALLGVGIFIRRNLKRTLKRLGFRLPEQGNYLIWFINGIKHLGIGVFVGFGMFWVQVGLTVIWQLFVSPETLAAQSAASQALFNALSGSLWLGFLVAFTAGVGEELLFRGALQPIFGNIIVSIFFVMLHSQYILTPASIIIFIVSLVFGFLRTHYTTPAAMMAHFIYNFTPFVIFSIISQYNISI